MVELLVIADDLTGALDSAGRLAAITGLVPVLPSLDSPLPAAQVAAYDLDTRRRSEDVARRRVTSAIRAARSGNVRLLYVKVDSTLRGHVGATVRAALRAWGSPSALVCPAFPAQGRTVERGELLVAGVPVHRTAFADDPRYPVRSADLRDHLDGEGVHHLQLETVRAGPHAVTRALGDTPGVWVADAVTDEDLVTLARGAVGAGLTLLAGSAGLLGALASTLELPRAHNHKGRPDRCGATLVIVGSRHPSSREQIRRLAAANVPGVHILSVADTPLRPGQEDEVARELATEAATRVTAQGVEAVVVVGGDTARAVVEALGVDHLAVAGEVLPGIPWGQLAGGPADGCAWVSKAGGFGDPQALVDVVRWLRGEEGAGDEDQDSTAMVGHHDG